MKTLLHLLFVVMLFSLTHSVEAISQKQTVSGQVVFATGFKQSVMEKHGYRYILTVPHGQYIRNYFGAKDVDIIVKNGKGEIIGVCKTKSDGTFALTVDKSNFYQITLEYMGRKIEKTISNTEATKTIQIDLGGFDTDYFPEILPPPR